MLCHIVNVNRKILVFYIKCLWQDESNKGDGIMKKMLFVVALTMIGSIFASDLSKNLTFEADYRTGSATPKVAKGDKKFTRYFNSPVVVEKGNGLEVGSKSATLRYNAAGNIYSHEGTIEILLEPIDYQINDDKKHGIFSCGGPNSSVNISIINGEAGAHFKIGKAFYHPRKAVADLGVKVFHLVATYTDSSFAFYLNGELLAKRQANANTDPFDLTGAKIFYVGESFQPWRNNGNSRIKFVRIYDRVLDEDEIEELANNATK